MVVVAVTVMSATDVAVIVTALGDGAVAGAVYTAVNGLPTGGVGLGVIVPFPVVVGRVHVTPRQFGFVVWLQP